MKLYLKINLFVLSFFITQFVLAQDGFISGRLLDQKEETIPFATVSVMQLPDSTLVTGTTTDLAGEFELKPEFTGEFVLKFSAIGFSPVYTSTFRISNESFSKDFGAILLKEEMTTLDEVMLETWKPRIEAENGNLVMRVEGTTMAAGNTAFEVVSRAPGVSVDQDGNFQLNGKQGVAIMIDGRLNYLSPQDVKTLLEGMPAENIKSIEVLNNPPAKYDAEGTAGILNITLKKNASTGLSGGVYGGFQVNEQEFFNGGLNLNYQKGRWNSFANLDISQRGSVRDQETERNFSGADLSVEQMGTETSRRTVPSLQAGTDYKINEDHLIGIMANLTYQDRKTDWNTNSIIRGMDPAGPVNIDARNHMEENFGHGRFNLHYSGDLDTSGTNISADLDYVRLAKESEGRFRNGYSYPNEASENLEELTNETVSDYDIYAAKVDLTLPLSETSSFGAGLKASKVISDSDLRFYTEEGNGEIDPERSDSFKYDEEIYAAYASFNSQFNDTWSLSAGLRAEKTIAEAQSITLDQTNHRNYLSFFPNLGIQQTVSDNYQINYSFSRRISRPDYERLNPFIFYLDPYTYIVGNPDLRSQITNSVQVSQHIFKNFNLLLGYDFAENYMAELPSMDPETRETVFSYRNLDHYKSLSATLVAPIEVGSFWNMNNTLVFTHQDYDMQINEAPLENNNYFFMAQSNHQVKLPWELKLEINGTYRSPMAYGVYNIGTQWWIDTGLKRSFMDDRLDVTLRGMDVFRTRQMNIDSEFLGNEIELSQYFGNQAVSINLRYNFSNGSSQSNTRRNNLEELDRAGTNG